MDERHGTRPSIVELVESLHDPVLLRAVQEHMETPRRVEQMKVLQAKVEKANNRPLLQRIGDIFRRS
jgi:hypothetical protein